VSAAATFPALAYMLAAADEPTVALVGFLDTKGAEHDFVANRLRASGCTVLVLDVSINDVCTLSGGDIAYMTRT
jgi:uncharacterized protein (UPF0261 family)